MEAQTVSSRRKRSPDRDKGCRFSVVPERGCAFIAVTDSSQNPTVLCEADRQLAAPHQDGRNQHLWELRCYMSDCRGQEQAHSTGCPVELQAAEL